MLTPWVGREPEEFADGLAGRRVSDAEVAELVAFAEHLCEAATVQPTKDFRDQLRAELMAEAETVLVREPAPAARIAPLPDSPRRRRLAAAVTSVILAGGGIGVAASSASALPGDTLYPIKRTIEGAQSVLHRSDADRAGYELQRAESRLGEASALVERGDADAALIAGALDEFANLSTLGAQRAMSQASAGDAAILDDVAAFTAQSAQLLADMAPFIPAEAAGSHSAAVAAVATVRDRLTVACLTCHDVSADALEDLRSAVQSAAGLVDETEAGQTTESTETESDTPQQSSAPTTSGNTQAQPQPSPAPTVVTPQYPASQTPTPLAPVTGLVLGDENRPGLIGSLLGR